MDQWPSADGFPLLQSKALFDQLVNFSSRASLQVSGSLDSLSHSSHLTQLLSPIVKPNDSQVEKWKQLGPASLPGLGSRSCTSKLRNFIGICPICLSRKKKNPFQLKKLRKEEDSDLNQNLVAPTFAFFSSKQELTLGKKVFDDFLHNLKIKLRLIATTRVV